MIRFDIEDAFQKIGRVSDVWVARKPPGFAFIEMEVRTKLFRPCLQNYIFSHHCRNHHNHFRTRGTLRMLAESLMEPESVATESRLVKVFCYWHRLCLTCKKKGKVNEFFFLARLR